MFSRWSRRSIWESLVQNRPSRTTFTTLVDTWMVISLRFTNLLQRSTESGFITVKKMVALYAYASLSFTFSLSLSALDLLTHRPLLAAIHWGDGVDLRSRIPSHQSLASLVRRSQCWGFARRGGVQHELWRRGERFRFCHGQGRRSRGTNFQTGGRVHAFFELSRRHAAVDPTDSSAEHR